MSITDPDALDRADMEKLQAGHDAALNDLILYQKENMTGGQFYFVFRD